MEDQTCNNCACDSVCDHNWNGWETCGNWQPVLVRCKDCRKYDTETQCCKFWPDEGYRHPDHFCAEAEQRDGDGHSIQ